jgi:hypothetical protein
MLRRQKSGPEARNVGESPLGITFFERSCNSIIPIWYARLERNVLYCRGSRISPGSLLTRSSSDPCLPTCCALHGTATCPVVVVYRISDPYVTRGLFPRYNDLRRLSGSPLLPDVVQDIFRRGNLPLRYLVSSSDARNSVSDALSTGHLRKRRRESSPRENKTAGQ